MPLSVAIAGLGAMGSAAAFHLARRGHHVIGFDRFAPPHQLASTTGETRIIREAYFEHPQYVPLVQRAYECWDELERLSRTTLLLKTGGLMIGAPGGPLVSGARTSAHTYDLPYEEWSVAELQQRYPVFQPAPGMTALWEPRAGLLFPDRCISAHLNEARKGGARLHTDEPVESWTADADGVAIVTNRGHYRADGLILSCGAWLPALLSDLRIPLAVERTVQHWFQAADLADRFLPERFPVYLFEYERDLLFYGFPDTGDGVKVARHHQGVTTTPESLDRRVAAVEVDRMRDLLFTYLPDANGAHLRSAVCMYTNTPDSDFVIDAHPESARVLVASPCSGHGFKFSSAVGEVLADLATGTSVRFDLSPFSIARFG